MGGWSRALASEREGRHNLPLLSLDELRAAIKSTISDRAAFPDVGAQIPRNYVALRDNVRAVRAAGKQPIMEWEEYRDTLAQPVGLEDKAALLSATALMHRLASSDGDWDREPS